MSHDKDEVKTYKQERGKTLILNTKLTKELEDGSGKKLLVARGKLLGTLKGRILPEPLRWKGKVTEVQISGFKEGCRDLRGRQLLSTGGVTSASCCLHNRTKRRPVTCFETPDQFISTHHFNGNNNNTMSPSQPRGSFQSNARVKTCDSLPAVKSVTGQSSPVSKRPDAARKRPNNSKFVTLSQLHKMITERKSLDEVMKDKNRVRISIKRTESGDNVMEPKTPKVKVMILNKQDSQVPMLPATLTHEIKYEEPKESFLFEEWRYIPDFNQQDLLRQLDSKGLRSLERTRAWLLSIPLDDQESVSNT